MRTLDDWQQPTAVPVQVPARALAQALVQVQARALVQALVQVQARG